jgi:hypothetical protein
LSRGFLESPGDLRDGEIDIDELDDKVAAQLASIKWTVDSRGAYQDRIEGRHAETGMASPDRADTVAQAFSRRGSAAPINVESHAGEGITGDLMTKAW